MSAAGHRSVPRVAFVYFTVEGLQVSRGGVGRWANNLLDLIPQLCAEWGERGVPLTPFVAEPRLSPATRGYDTVRLGAARMRLADCGGGLHLLANETAAEVTSAATNFDSLAIAATQVVLDLADRYDVVFSLSGESAFARLPVMVDRQLDDCHTDVRLVHTHGVTVPDGPYDLVPAELAGDAALAAWVRRSARIRIAYISQFMRDVFVRQYAVPEERLLPNISGIRLSDPAFASRSPEDDARLLASRGVPEDRSLAITWGRNSRPGLDKGYGLLLEAAALVGEDVVPVVITRDPDPGLAALAADVAPWAVVLSGEPYETIAAVLRAPNTVAACFLSASEHGAVAPMEAAWTAGLECVLVAVPTGSFRELIIDGETGVVAARTRAGVATALRSVRDAGPQRRRQLRDGAAELVRRNHDMDRNVRALFEAVLDDLAR